MTLLMLSFKKGLTTTFELRTLISKKRRLVYSAVI